MILSFSWRSSECGCRKPIECAFRRSVQIRHPDQILQFVNGSQFVICPEPSDLSCFSYLIFKFQLSNSTFSFSVKNCKQGGKFYRSRNLSISVQFFTKFFCPGIAVNLTFSVNFRPKLTKNKAALNFQFQFFSVQLFSQFGVQSIKLKNRRKKSERKNGRSTRKR